MVSRSAAGSGQSSGVLGYHPSPAGHWPEPGWTDVPGDPRLPGRAEGEGVGGVKGRGRGA